MNLFEILTFIWSLRKSQEMEFLTFLKATNKYLKSHSKHIIYLDANNLHGYATLKYLQTGRFKPVDPKDFDLNEYNNNSSKCCVLEVDLKYPNYVN